MRRESNEGVFASALTGPSAIGWNLSRLVRERYPEAGIVDALPAPFDVLEYARAGRCEATVSRDEHASFVTSWSRDHGLCSTPQQAVYDVRWKGRALKVVMAHWREDYHEARCSTVVAETEELARLFAHEVAAFCNDPEKTILCFTGGCWSGSHELWRSVREASFDDLILAGDLKERLIGDFKAFLGAKAEYVRYGVAYKRGALLVGPPGNGKTHCLRALLKLLDLPTLYVMSLKSTFGTEDGSISEVFSRARDLTPCCLVFEDLDAMINAENRSFFLNQLDGLGESSGLVTIATTNHPEQLDPAILRRPSRFDRKYHFDLPGALERERYLERWNARVALEMQIDAATVRELALETDGFSFAYLKELYLAAMMRWMGDRGAATMAAVLRGESEALRAQMNTGASAERAAKAPVEA